MSFLIAIFITQPDDDADYPVTSKFEFHDELGEDLV
jgi:hypothetical protein